MDFFYTLFSADKFVDFIIATVGTFLAFGLTLFIDKLREKKQNASTLESAKKNLGRAKRKLKKLVYEDKVIIDAKKLLEEQMTNPLDHDKLRAPFFRAYAAICSYSAAFDLPLIDAAKASGRILDFEGDTENDILTLFSALEDLSRFINSLDKFETEFAVHRKAVGLVWQKAEKALEAFNDAKISIEEEIPKEKS